MLETHSVLATLRSNKTKTKKRKFLRLTWSRKFNKQMEWGLGPLTPVPSVFTVYADVHTAVTSSILGVVANYY